MPTTITLRDDAHWRELRSQHIGGSECAALFGEHPQISHFELWHRKKKNLPEPDLSNNSRVLWGQLLEPAVAKGVAAKTGWNINKVHRYHSLLPELGLGSSLDFEITANERGPGVLEIKTADWLVVRDWPDGEPPLSYELQVQTEMAVTGRKWGAMGVLVGGNDLRIFEYTRRDNTIQIIRDRVAEFWRSIAEDRPPEPNYAKDVGIISKLYRSTVAGKVAQLSDSIRAIELVEQYKEGMAQEKAGKALKDAAKAELLPMIGESEAALVDTYRISCKMIAAQSYHVDKEAYRDFRVSGKPRPTAS